MNYRQIYARKAECEKRIKEVCPDCPNTSGIYFLLREENGFRYAYIGQAKHLLTRLAQHLTGYQRIDLSLRKHGLFKPDNPNGWKINFLEFPEEKLDEMEQKYILNYANAGYQLRNVESGGKQGKTVFGEKRQSKGYHDGIENGKEKTRLFIADLFKKHLDFVPKNNPPTKLQGRAMKKFEDFLKKGDEK